MENIVVSLTKKFGMKLKQDLKQAKNIKQININQMFMTNKYPHLKG